MKEKVEIELYPKNLFGRVECSLCPGSHPLIGTWSDEDGAWASCHDIAHNSPSWTDPRGASYEYDLDLAERLEVIWYATEAEVWEHWDE